MGLTVSWSPSSAYTNIPRLFHGRDCFTISTLCTYTDIGSRGYFGVLRRSCSCCCRYYTLNLGPVSIWRLSFPVMGILMLKIRQSRDRLIVNMGIPILVKWHVSIEMAPGLMVRCCRRSLLENSALHGMNTCRKKSNARNPCMPSPHTVGLSVQSGDGRYTIRHTNNDKMGKVFFFFLGGGGGGGGPLVSHHNLLEVPSWVIYANNTEPLDEHWTMRRTLEKSALWRWGELNSKLNAMGIFLPMFLHMLAVAQRVRKFACRPASNGALRTTAWIWAKHRNGPSWCNRKCQDNVYVRREHQSTM